MKLFNIGDDSLEKFVLNDPNCAIHHDTVSTPTLVIWTSHLSTTSLLANSPGIYLL
jgi:hypothetical protein